MILKIKKIILKDFSEAFRTQYNSKEGFFVKIINN